MTITVTKLKRVIVELRDDPAHGACDHFAALARNPTALTMLAEKLSERPDGYDSRTLNVEYDGPGNPSSVYETRDGYIGHPVGEPVAKQPEHFDYKAEGLRRFPAPEGNGKREGWNGYFEGRGSQQSPFPPSRADLHKAYKFGWDEAASFQP